MAGKLAQAVESVKDKVLGAPIYKTTVKKFKTTDLFLKALVNGDVVIASDSISAMPNFGIASGSSHEIDKVVGKVLVLRSGRRILAEWFVPEIRRRERVRQKADRPTLIALASAFAATRWADFKGRIDAEIKAAEDQVVRAVSEVERAQNRLKQVQDAVVKLKQAKVDGEAWPLALADRLISVVDQKLFTNFEQVREGEVNVFIVYTGSVWAEKKAGDPMSRERGEYALKIYPQGSPTRIVIENVAPGKLAGDVPHNENRSGICNVCFGGQNSDLETLVRDEDWCRALTMIRAFLEGNRTN